jgi:hypothetical protein
MMGIKRKCSNKSRLTEQMVDREFIVLYQSCISTSRRMRSRTSRRPPASFLTRRGLRVNTSALSSLPRLGPGLVGTSFSPDVCVEAGISNHSCPSTSSGLRKNGHREVKMVRDSWASAVDIGTGDDFKTAEATSEAGKARRLRVESPALGVEGPEKSLKYRINKGTNQ